MRCLLVAMVAMVMLVAGCSSAPAPSTPLAPSPQPGSVRVTREEYGEKWPLTVEAGTIHNVDRFALTFETDDHQVYALNGTAKDRKLGKDIRPIWADNPRNGRGVKKDIGPLIERGQALDPGL